MSDAAVALLITWCYEKLGGRKSEIVRGGRVLAWVGAVAVLAGLGGLWAFLSLSPPPPPSPPATPRIAPPSPTPTSRPAPTAIPTPTPTPTWPAEVLHRVDAGEWLLQVARCYGTSPEAILGANRIDDPDRLLAGTSIRVPGVGTVGAVTGPPCVERHRVEAGEDAEGLSRRFDIDKGELLRINGLPPGSDVRPGMVLEIPRPLPPEWRRSAR